MTQQISVLVVLGAGLLSFLSPCVLPMVPVYFASLYGPEIFEDKTKRFRLPLFLHSLAFVLGFSFVFSLWGAGAGLVGSALLNHLTIVRQISGGLLIAFGLFMLISQKIPWLNYEKRLAPGTVGTVSYLRSFLTGSIFTFAWTPCAGPILGGVLALAVNEATVLRGAFLLGIYSLGLGVPFLILGIVFNSIMPLLKRIRKYSAVINIVSAILLIIVGILVLTDNLIWLQL
ncbi:MAG: cytochrome c biogenesis protein CcdA [Chloroflexota bacterium]